LGAEIGLASHSCMTVYELLNLLVLIRNNFQKNLKAVPNSSVTEPLVF
jgi:hypothetical protein